jgi:hypothetical protein
MRVDIEVTNITAKDFEFTADASLKAGSGTEAPLYDDELIAKPTSPLLGASVQSGETIESYMFFETDNCFISTYEFWIKPSPGNESLVQWFTIPEDTLETDGIYVKEPFFQMLSLKETNDLLSLSLVKPDSNTHASTRICNQSVDTLTYASISLNATNLREVGGDNSTSVRISSGDALIPGSLNDGTSWNVATGNLDGMYNIGAYGGVNVVSYLEIIVHEPLVSGACVDLSWASDPQTVADPSQYGIYYHPAPNSDRIRNAIVSGRIELEALEAGSRTDGNGMRHPRTHFSFKRSDDSEYFCQVLERDLLRCSDAREFSLDQTSTSSWSGPTYGRHSSLFATDDSGGPD